MTRLPWCRWASRSRLVNRWPGRCCPGRGNAVSTHSGSTGRLFASVAQAARRGILVKGGGPIEALAPAQTVLFDKTGTLTVGGARLLLIEMARGRKADDVLLLGASLEQASHHTLAEAVVKAAIDRALRRRSPDKSGKNHGVGLARDDRRQVSESRLPGNDPPAQTHAALGAARLAASLIAIRTGGDRCGARCC